MKDLFDKCNKEKSYLLSFLQSEFALSFEGKKCAQSGSVHLFENSLGWWVKNFNTAKHTQLPEMANFGGLVYQITNQITDGKERINKQLQIIAACNNQILPTTNVPTNNSSTPSKTTPTNNSPKKQPLKVSFVSWATACGKLTLEYYKKKAGVTIETLDKYGIKPLKSHIVGAMSRPQMYGGSFFGFGWCVGDNTKIKRPTDKVKIMQGIKGTTPYIFGFEQLPNKGKSLIFCGGEDDALCINQHCNKLGIFAVCLRSENDQTTLIKSLVNELKSRFDTIYVLYDADKAGVKFSRILAQKWGFVWVNIALYLPELSDKDICDIYKNSGISGVVIFAQHCTDFHTNVKAVESDIFSIDVPFAYKLNFNQYLGENLPFEAIKSLLMYESKLSIQSPAGTGKSTVIQDLCKPETNGKNFVFNSLGIEKTIVACPTTAIALQLQKDFEKRGVLCGIMTADTKGIDKDNNRLFGLVVTTYDSLKDMLEFIPSSLLIIDEFHQIANDYDYRNKAMSIVWDCMQDAPRVLLLSATPNYLFCSHLADYFNFALLVCYPTLTNQIRLNVLDHKEPKKYLIDYIEENAPSTGTTCIKFDNNTSLSTYLENDLKRAIKSDHFTSGSRNRKEENEHYKGIMQNGKTAFDLDKIYFTTLFEAGVSFNFAVGLVAIFDVKSWSKIIQLSTRPRLHKNSVGEWVNKEIDVWIFNSTGKKSATTVPTKGAKVGERWLQYLADAQIQSDKLNAKKKGTIKHKVRTDIDSFSIVDAQGFYVPNVPRILHEIFKEETSETDIPTLIERIVRFDPRFSLATNGHREIEVCANADLTYTFELKKEEKELGKVQFLELLKNEPITTLQAVLRLSKDKDFKADAKVCLGLPMVAKEQVLQLTNDNKNAFASNDKTRVVRDLMFLVGEQNKTLQDAIVTVIETDKKVLAKAIDTHQLTQRIRTHKATPSELDQSDKLEIERYKAVIAKFQKLLDNIKQGKRKAQFSAFELAKITNESLAGLKVKALTQKGVIEYLDMFYQLERIRVQKNNDRIYLYRILTIKKIR